MQKLNEDKYECDLDLAKFNVLRQNDFRKDIRGEWGQNLREPITSQYEWENRKEIQ